ncbi:hypothetical protein F4780DRAFT_340244 [Xylariomycetidae sp. FL0641]|nr:hypothetical protein F4780DRAFT_340244 [Xylariomycetidae sp. FL0641]
MVVKSYCSHTRLSMSALRPLLDRLGPEIDDPEEETFVLFSREIPSQDLGFVDPRAPALDFTIAGRDLVIHQSPTVLRRPGSTTGAVVWKITPLVAAWLASPDTLLRAAGVLTASARVLELGCGASALVGLALAPLVARYVLTDQAYVARLVEKNIAENRSGPAAAAVVHPNHNQPPAARPGKRRGKSTPPPVVSRDQHQQHANNNLRFTPLDWELDAVTPDLTGGGGGGVDLVVACDCVYNSALVAPHVQACADVCRLRAAARDARPTVCLVAQLLRTDDVLEAWLRAFTRHFRAWRVPDRALSPELRSNPAFVVFVGVLKEAFG